MKLEGKVAVVTGGTSGIGLAIAKEFIAEGARVAVIGNDPRRLDAASIALGERAIAIPGDVTKVEDIEGCYAEVVAKLGGIDVVVCSAGGDDRLRSFLEVDEAEFDAISARDFKSVFFTVQKAVPCMSDGGAVVIIGSGARKQDYALGAVYAASKAASLSLTRSLSVSLLPSGIRVNAISPGLIDTPFTAEVMSERFRGVVAEEIPMSRAGRPEEIAKAALFLASDDSSYVVGVELDVDGGISSHNVRPSVRE